MSARRRGLLLAVLGGLGAVTALLALALGRAALSDGSSPLVGAPAPALQGRTLAGEHFRLDHQPGRLTVVNIWASWCGPCRQELPLVADLADRWSDRDVRFVTVDTRDGPVAARSLLHEVGVRHLLTVLDPQGRIAVSWGATGVPETFVVDGNGTIRARQAGPVSADWLRGQLEHWSDRSGAAARTGAAS